MTNQNYQNIKTRIINGETISSNELNSKRMLILEQEKSTD